MTTTSRDRLIENKLSILERRLVLVERFVEMRFCESFRDFSIRNDNISNAESLPVKKVIQNGNDVSGRGKRRGRKPKAAAQAIVNQAIFANDTEDDCNDDGGVAGSGSSMMKESTAHFATRRTRSGRSTRPPARLSDVKPASTRKSIMNTVKVQLVRLEDNQSVTGTPSKYNSKGAVTAMPAEPIIKTAPMSEDEVMSDNGGGDDYFTFPSDGLCADANDESRDNDPHDNDLERQDNDHNHNPTDDLDEDSEDIDSPTSEDDDLSDNVSDMEYPPSKRRKAGRTSHGSPSKRSFPKPSSTPGTSKKRGRRKKPRPQIVSSGQPLPIENLLKIECDVCHKFFRKELMPSHMEFHTKERHLKCSWCDKTFFNKNMVIKHEKLHQPEKYARKCRLCDKTTIESGKMLVHERSCIRRALEQNKFVDPRLLEEIRQRSRGLDLKWPDTPGTTAAAIAVASSGGGSDDRKCTYCGVLFPISLYTRHLKKHATWRCVMCLDKAYMNKEGLVKHMRNFHGVIEEDVTEEPAENDNTKKETETSDIVNELLETESFEASQDQQNDKDNTTVQTEMEETLTVVIEETVTTTENT